MMKNYRFLLLLVSSLTLVSCFETKGDSGKERNTESQQLQLAKNAKIQHANAVVALINRDTREQYAYERYTHWIDDIQNGPTLDDAMQIQAFEIPYSEFEQNLFKEILSKNAYPILNDKTNDYQRSFEKLVVLMKEVVRYYSEEDFKDDDLKRGKEMHLEILQLTEMTHKKRSELQDSLGVILDNQVKMSIEEHKIQGRKIAYNLELSIQTLDTFATVLTNEKVLDVEEVKGLHRQIGDIENELRSLADGIYDIIPPEDINIENSKNWIYRYAGDVESCLKSSKKLIRSLEAEENEEVEKHIKSYLHSYQYLIEGYNKLVQYTDLMNY